MNKKLIFGIIIGIIAVMVGVYGLKAVASDWKTYTFPGSPYIISESISLKYPSNWKLEQSYYTTPANVKDITSITLTSQTGIEQITFSNGGRQAELDCDKLLKQNIIESGGHMECKMINGTPFYLTYITNKESVDIYNKILLTITK